ncbi:hypothetical protein A3C57_01360 [Candidatus Nomurabacteria bacterium RIFCSPHIGHO2_02_FULL_33_12]|uniref:tRNA uridine(34) hydroxylase n=1 Tax=Candidatus Nomurabacteria bacterium RIFCSPLOWO2_01_FULL_33_17 TaxID=1801764 RepID=A0A1F6WQB9_9BACT|nr:MAG: hypothetical protein A3C57_01360 [Candidatus Nomurabacteria bacterium RIFCSPHIGHO2_02_FULL_33_12]OGI84056.1 MAG: hypothetical protein A2903_01845 [Candidatus Nomurabacteria bacterium RIFCSPLOWO2_01_FULL_33_17]
MESVYTILLFYKYVRIKDPELVKEQQKSVCEAFGFKGRIIIAQEGINATFEGKIEDVEKYIIWMKQDKRFKDTHWKKSIGIGDAFPKLSVKVRNEIVSLHVVDGGTDINPKIITGKRLKPKKLDKWYKEGKEFYVVDMRNDYELKSGCFKDTIFPGLKNFRDLRDKITEIDHLKDKTVLIVCTGGVRCEKASGLLVQQGFKDVYQLDGGIVSYMEQFPGQAFEGSLYVFDKRTLITYDDPANHTVIGKCDFCDTSTETYYDCNYPICHSQFLACNDCIEKSGGFCKTYCEKKFSNVTT